MSDPKMLSHDLTGAKLEAERAIDDVAAYALILGRAEGRAEERAAWDPTVCVCGAKLPPERRGLWCVDCAEIIPTEPLLHEDADGTVTLEWRDDRTATLVSREFLDGMVQAHNAARRGTVSNPAWCRGYDAGLTIGTGIGQGRERAAIVAWLRVQPFLIKWPWAAAAGIERGEHLRGDDE